MSSPRPRYLAIYALGFFIGGALLSLLLDLDSVGSLLMGMGVVFGLWSWMNSTAPTDDEARATAPSDDEHPAHPQH